MTELDNLFDYLNDMLTRIAEIAQTVHAIDDQHRQKYGMGMVDFYETMDYLLSFDTEGSHDQPT